MRRGTILAPVIALVIALSLGLYGEKLGDVLHLHRAVDSYQLMSGPLN